MSMAEFRADKDQLRAEFAVSTRRLETTVDRLRRRLAVAGSGHADELGPMPIKPTPALGQGLGMGPHRRQLLEGSLRVK